MMKCFYSLTAALLVSFLPSVCAAGTVTISDATFNDADWSARSDATEVGSSSGLRVPIGGNPGSYRQIRNTGFLPGFTFNDSIGWHFYESEFYDPAAGEILSIDYTEDTLHTQGNRQSVRLALRQDDILFRSKQEFAIDQAPDVWEARGLNDLVASDFEALFNGAFIPSAAPDFSATGSPINFGVYRRITVGRGNFDSRTGIDNWRVELTTAEVPEPASMTLFLTACAMAYRRSR